MENAAVKVIYHLDDDRSWWLVQKESPEITTRRFPHEVTNHGAVELPVLLADRYFWVFDQFMKVHNEVFDYLLKTGQITELVDGG